MIDLDTFLERAQCEPDLIDVMSIAAKEAGESEGGPSASERSNASGHTLAREDYRRYEATALS